MRALVVAAHPDPESFGGAVRERVLRGLEAGGHEVRLIDLYAEDFDPRLTAHERRHHLSPPDTKPAIAAHAEALRWCEALVLVYPTWWGNQPAILKGWFDRVWVEGVAYTLPPGGDRIRPLLRNVRRLVVVTTHGSPKGTNALQGEPGKRIVLRGLRLLCHPRCRSRWVSLYGLDASTAEDRAAFLDRVERRLRRP